MTTTLADFVLRLESVTEQQFEGSSVTVFNYGNDHAKLSFHAHPTQGKWIVHKEEIGVVLATHAITEFSRLVNEAELDSIMSDIEVLRVVNKPLEQLPSRVQVLRI